MEGTKFSPKLSPEDAYKFLVCNTHIGTDHVDFQAGDYIFKRREDGIHLINLGYTWEKLMFAARAIAAIKNPADVCIVSSRPQAQRALLKFAAHTGATSIVGRFIPGSFTNQIQKNFKEPRLIIVSDARADHQAIREASYTNIPVIAFSNTDSPLKHIDIAIPCNNKGVQSLGLMWWMLAREVLRLRGEITVEENHFKLGDKKIMPDLYFFREPEDTKKEEEEKEKEKQREEEAKQQQRYDEEPMDFGGNEKAQIQFERIQIDDWAASMEQNPEPSAHATEAPQNQQAEPAAANDDDEW